MSDLRGRSTAEVLDFYRRLVEPEPGYVGYSEASLKRVLAKTILTLPRGSVVDLGCGPNPVVLIELGRNGWETAAVDLSPDFCERARNSAERAGLTLRVANRSVHETGFAESEFDVAILSETLEHVPDELEVPTLVEAFRILRPGGWLVVSVPNAASWFTRYQEWRTGAAIDHPQHLREYTHRRLRPLVEAAGFRIERALRVPATTQPLRRARAAWTIDRVARRPEWSLKVALLASKPDGGG